MTGPALAVLALHAVAGAGPVVDLHVSASAGAGYDSNVSHDEQADAAVSSALLLASAGVSAVHPARSWSFGADLLVDATDVRDVPDLSEIRGGAGAFLAWYPADRVALDATATGARSWWRDPARDAWQASLAASVRVRVARRVAVIGSGGRSWSDASDPVYSYAADRLGGRVEVRVASRSYAWAGYAWSRRDEVFYQTIATTAGAPRAGERAAGGPPADGGPSGGGGTRRGPDGRPVTGSFPGGDREVVRADARTGTARAGVEIGLGAGLHLGADASYVSVSSDVEDYDAWVASLLLGFRR